MPKEIKSPSERISLYYGQKSWIQPDQRRNHIDLLVIRVFSYVVYLSEKKHTHKAYEIAIKLITWSTMAALLNVVSDIYYSRLRTQHLHVPADSYY